MHLLRATPIAIVVVSLLACGGGSSVAPAPPGAPDALAPKASTSTSTSASTRVAHQLGDETKLTTRSGAPLTATKGWWLTNDGDVVLLEDPDRALKAWFVESAELDPARAIATAWQRVTPGFRLAGELDTPPPTDGWDAITTGSYDAGGERIVFAEAHRLGARTHVALVDGARAAVLRRSAQLDQMRATWRPAGLHEESFAGKTPRRLEPAQASELDAFIRDALARLGVPGAAVAVVQGNAVLYESAFGLRELGKKERVTADTLFMIGSITKPMTSLMEAALVDAGVFDWKTPVTSVLPSFALGDAELTRKIEMWHMSCACTGMPRNDVEHLFEFEKITPEDRVASMKELKPTTGLGETYQYSNLMYAAGGFVAAHAYAPKASLGDAYATAMRKTIFEPIGMKASTLDFAVVQRSDHATPHATAIDGTVRSIPITAERNVLPIAPAGAVWSTVHDMERYVMTELSRGVAPGGKRVVSEKNLMERRILRTGDAATGGYGLGVDVGRFHGLEVLAHDGGALGFGATMFILPEPQIAIVILTNVRNGSPTEYLPFNAVMKRRLIEALFESARPLAAAQLDYHVAGMKKAREKSAGKVQLTVDRDRVKPLVGTYANARLGTLTLSLTPAGATLDAGEWKSAVGQRVGKDGTLTLVFLDPPFPGSEYLIGGDETKPTITVNDGQASYVFVRQSARR